jgi:hypothetical protein
MDRSAAGIALPERFEGAFSKRLMTFAGIPKCFVKLEFQINSQAETLLREKIRQQNGKVRPSEVAIIPGPVDPARW